MYVLRSPSLVWSFGIVIALSDAPPGSLTEDSVKNLFNACFALAITFVSTFSFAQTSTQVVLQDSYRVLGGDTVALQTTVESGLAPKNDSVKFVYDPEFHFFMKGQLSEPSLDRTSEFASYGYVVVAAAGDPGGYYSSEPSWITQEGFSASFDSATSMIDLSYSYGATYVPTFRGFQSFVIYANLTSSTKLGTIYDDSLNYGANNFLLTGDGPETFTTVSFDAPSALEGQNAIKISTSQDADSGTHWKLMLFANGSAAGYPGVDLRGYDSIAFYAKANRPVVLNGAFGTGDDSAQRGFVPLELSTEYQRYELDLSGLDLSDVNTFVWLYMHKNQNAFDYAGVSVYLDDVKLLSARETFSTSEGDFELGEQINSSGVTTNLHVGFASSSSFVIPSSVGWYLTRAAVPAYEEEVLFASAELVNVYVRRCSDDLWVPIDQTPYSPLRESVSTSGGVFFYNPHSSSSPLPGIAESDVYACGGSTRVIPTLIGDETLRTDAGVTFAYLVHHTN